MAEKIPEEIQQSVQSLVLALDDLADIEIENITTDREEDGGLLCYDPKTEKYQIKPLGGINDSMINTPTITVSEIVKICPENTISTFWHTHGTMLHSFSDLDRYSAGDMATTGKRIGICSLGVDEIQCHYAFMSVPQVVNIGWDGKIEEKLKKISEKEIVADDLLCDSEMNCSIRNWNEGVVKEQIGSFDQLNTLDGVVASIGNKSGTVVSDHHGLRCFEVVSEDGFRSLNCFSKEDGK